MSWGVVCRSVWKSHESARKRTRDVVHGFAKRRVGPGWSRICKVWGGKDEAGQGFCGLRIAAWGLRVQGVGDPAHKRDQCPLVDPPQGRGSGLRRILMGKEK
jgi:hypothetical protein